MRWHVVGEAVLATAWRKKLFPLQALYRRVHLVVTPRRDRVITVWLRCFLYETSDTGKGTTSISSIRAYHTCGLPPKLAKDTLRGFLSYPINQGSEFTWEKHRANLPSVPSSNKSQPGGVKRTLIASMSAMNQPYFNVNSDLLRAASIMAYACKSIHHCRRYSRSSRPQI